MKTNYKQRQPARKSLGVALFLVLAFLALIITLVLAFFSSVSSELTGARSAASGATAKQLGDTAVQVVASVIRMATSSSSKSVAWASQPGMIRTYGSPGGAASSAPLAYFKLYSSDDMEITQSEIAAFNTSTDPQPDLVTDWDLKPALFTDLNSPVIDSGRKIHFPIIDPRAQTAPGTGTVPATSVVDGFSYSDTAIRSDGTTVKMNKVDVGGSGANSQRLPMPVKWIYVLRDGTLTAPRGVDVATGKIANWTGETNVAKKPSATNPIVGRIAFWTDDETCKVNINTASEGVYWDVPRIYSQEDYGQYSINSNGLAISQPVQHEFQRYPGHPATTCLSAVFGSANWNPALLPVSAPYPSNPNSTDSDKLNPYYNIAPRVGLPGSSGGGGSKGGSTQVNASTAVLITDRDRLYASVDELMFTPNLSGTARIPNTSTSSAPQTITKDVLEKTRFFLTASSSAPETTLFNTPRVAVWPINATPAKNTAYDKLLAFCSTIGDKKAYYITRSDARNSTNDYNLTALDGSKRNQLMYAYLQRLTGSNIPGFGGSFLAKYPAGADGISDRDQILTFIYDYIRCTNLQDQSSGATPYTPLFAAGQPLGAGEVIPIKIGQTQGFGRFYSITSANLLFYGTQGRVVGGSNPLKYDTTKMRAVFFFSFTTPMHGLACMRSNVKFKVKQGLDGFQASGKSLNFKPGGTNYMDTSDLNTFAGRSVGGTEHPWQAIVYKPFDVADAGGDARGKYPFFSAADVDVVGKTTFAFTASSEVVVEIRTADSDQLVQTVHFNFPPGQFKTPGISGTTAAFSSRTVGSNYNYLINPKDGDTVVALQVGGADLSANENIPGVADDFTAGDVRLTAALPDILANRFRADNKYKTDGVQFAHSLVASSGVCAPNGVSYYDGGTFGKLVNVASYLQPITLRMIRQPDVPSRVSTGVTRKDGGPGDWDTGFGDQKDGAYINKPDEGDTALTDMTNGQRRLPYMLGYGLGFSSATNTYFSPNRMIPSPLMFGSIPTGVQRRLPWQTLLFHPRPEDLTHPGFGTPIVPVPGIAYTLPPDHLIADLFWMPVVEPYAISQPFATSGKINLNYQIAPFTYINRATGLHAVMKSTKFAAIPLSDSTIYKPIDASGHGLAPTTPNRRRNIDVGKTLAAFDEKFKNNDLFRSASQICEMNLVPTTFGPQEVAPPASPSAKNIADAMVTVWNNNKLTGDNLREKPYVDLYSRLTTKSNVYTVHFRVQVLKKGRSTDATKWDETKDSVLSEHRGSSLIERYVDASDTTLPNFATDSTKTLDAYYKFRVLSTKKF